MASFQPGQNIPTARINELPGAGSFGPLTIQSLMLLWLYPFNKTVQVPISDLIPFFQTGGGVPLATVVQGADIIKVIPQNIAAGTKILAIPELAGKSFYAERGGQPMLLNDEFVILSSGGLQLTDPNDQLQPGERFHLFVYSLVSGNTQGGTSNRAWIIGEIPINADTLYTSSHLNKLIQFRAGNTSVSYSLPLVNDVPENTIIPIEATIGNNAEHRITTQGGQNIYFDGVGKTAVYLRPGEAIWLYRAADGWYDFAGMLSQIYDNIGVREDGWKKGRNQLVLNGQELQRSAFPRLWAWVQTLGDVLVPEATWQTPFAYKKDGVFSTSQPTGSYITIPRPYRGCFSQGDGSTTFRIPDLMDQFIRALKSETGTDSERFYNKPGGAQEDQFRSHNHTFETDGDNSLDNSPGGFPHGRQNADNRREVKSTSSVGGSETRPVNIGLLPLINV